MILIFLALFAPGRAYHAIEQFCARQGLPCNRTIWRPAGLTMHFVYYLNFLFLFDVWQGLPCKLCIILILFSLLAPGRAYHAFCVLFEFFFPFGIWQGLPCKLCIILISFYFLIGARQGLPCNKSEGLHPSWLICNLAPGRAYHAIYVLS